MSENLATPTELLEYEKKKFALQLQTWRKRPDIWLKERFGEDIKDVLWSEFSGYENHEWDGSVNPLFKAWYELGQGNWVGLESATGTGKTRILARIVYWFCDVYENSQVHTSAPKESQLLGSLWKEMGKCFKKFKKIRPNATFNKLRLRVNAVDLNKDMSDEDSESVGWGAVGFVAGVKANEESTTKAQGIHAADMLIICEEAAGMPLPTLTAFVATSTGSHNLILCAGNPDSVVDPLHTFISRYAYRVKYVRISAYDHPNVVTKKEVFKGATTQGMIDLMKSTYKEENWFFQSRVRGICPSQGKNSLIHYDWIMRCIKGSDTYYDIKPDRSWNAVGIDVANSEDGDKACLAWGEKNTLKEVHEFQCPNANHLAYNVALDNLELARKGYQSYHTNKLSFYKIRKNFIGIDAVGVGAGTVNTFKDMKYDPYSIQGGADERAIPKDKQGKPMYAFSNMRSQVYFMLAMDLQEGEIIIDIKDRKVLEDLIKELISIQYENKNQKINVESKDAIKRKLSGKSPNMADSVAYWNFVRKGFHNEGLGVMPIA